MSTPARQHRLNHAGQHWRANGWPDQPGARANFPPPRPTPAMRTRMHEELDRLLTTGCSWCMAASLGRLRPLLEHLQADEYARRLAQLDHDHEEDAAA